MVLGGPCLFHGPFTLIRKQASTSIYNWYLSLTKNRIIQKSNPGSSNFGLAFLPPEVSRGLEIRPITWCHGGTPRTVKWGACRDSSRRQHQWPTEDVWFTFGSWSHWSWFGFRCSSGEKWRCWGVLEVGWEFFRFFGMLCGCFRRKFFPCVCRWYCLVMIFFPSTS